MWKKLFQQKPHLSTGMSLARRRVWYAPGGDKTPGDDDKTPAATENATGQTGSDQDRQGQAGAQNGGTGEDKVFSQADVDRIVSERMARERRKAEDEKRQAEQEAERKRLEEEGQFKEANDQLKADLKTAQDALKQATEERDAYRERLEVILKERREGLPAHLIALLDNLDPLRQLDWLTSNADQLRAGDDAKRKKGVPPTPGADDTSEADKKQRGEEASKATSKRYSQTF